MAFLKSLPPYILKPHGEGPIRFSVSAIEWSDEHRLKSNPEKKTVNMTLDASDVPNRSLCAAQRFHQPYISFSQT